MKTRLHAALTRLFGALLLLCALTTAANAQHVTPVEATAEQLILHPGDTLMITLPHPDGLKQHPAEIDAQGAITLGLYGRVVVGGLRLAQAQEKVRTHLGSWLSNTQGVFISIQERAILVFVSGHVATPGTVKLSQDQTPWAAIQRAGAPLPGADITRASLWRDGQETKLDLSAYLQGRVLPQQDTTLRAGDTIFVPARAGVVDVRTGQVELLDQAALQDHVFILGAVKQAGLYRRPPTLTPWTLLAMAQGPLADSDLAHARWITAQTQQQLDLSDPTLSASLQWPQQGAAILYIPPSSSPSRHQPYTRGIVILGAVNQQGKHPISGPITLPQALALAQGPNERADLSKVTVTTQGDGFSISITYDMEEALAHGGHASQVQLSAGQTIFVHAADKTTWKSIARTISDIAILAAAFSVFAAL